ncbi:MAG: 50S ribosomal protein L4 [Candidatus Woesearchaeota archaeon]|nr:50S ribosomal protein L4 [Candidatus Woesearchaeota archaeon]
MSEKMKLDIISVSKSAIGKKDLPAQFHELIRPDLIKRAVEAIQANKRQPYGAYDHAGLRQCAELSRRRRDYKGSYGHGISRVPRKTLSRRGTNMYWVGAVAPGTVGGRRAHPAKADKILSKKINKKERRKAIRSALAATLVRNLAERRGHIVPKEYPFILESKAENLANARSVEECLTRIGFEKELERVSERRQRSGRGKLRGRRYRTKRGPLIVVSKECPLIRSAGNIPGLEVVEVSKINVDLLAPGATMGRLTIFTDAAIDRLAKENLFMMHYQGPNTYAKEEKKEDPKKEKMVHAAKASGPKAAKPAKPVQKK